MSKGEVRSTIGVFGYQRIFVENFLKIAAPLTKLLKKETPFEWTMECTVAIQQLKRKLTNEPVLWQPQMEWPFFLEVDASDYATGAVLFQKDKEGRPQICRYHSKTFNETEQWYEIYDKELTAIDRALANWQHLLKGAEVHILTDHKNLMYYWPPHKLMDHAKRVQQRMGEYNYVLHHKPGITNRADALSRCLDYPVVNWQNEEQLLQNAVFVSTIQVQDIDKIIKEAQIQEKHVIQDFAERYALERKNNLWHHQDCIVVVGNNDLKQGVISLYHDFSLAGHPGAWHTFSLLGRDYWWPKMKQEVDEYVKGCATCQSTKPWTNVPKAPLHPIMITPNAIPFEIVNINFITKLPISKGYDSIMTIVNHDCTKAAIFIPCKEQMDALGTAELYAKHIFPHYGLLQHIILDCDVRFTSAFTRELCEILQIKQNLSSAYHPQTDGLAEQTNQWVEQYLRIFGNVLQNDWADHLPMAQFVHNMWPHEVTKQSPFELLISNNPRTVIPVPSQKVPVLEDRRELLTKTRWLAQKAMVRAQNLLWQTKRKHPFVPYQEGQKVWLEVTNLKTTHPTAKLAPRWYGPFTITWVISSVVYQLQIPPHWRIHNVFHISLLSPYIETQTYGPNFEEPPPDLIKELPEWEVQQILDSWRFRNKKTLQYWVWWKGYSAAHDSWELVSNVFAPELIKDYYKSKGATAVNNITPSQINTMTTPSSAASSTLSYICKITAQFQQNPLPNFTMLGTPDTFGFNGPQQAGDLDSPEVPTPPPITLSPSTYESLIECIEHDILYECELTGWPGNGWELTTEASHSHSPMINNPTTNTLHEAKWVKFVIDKDSGELKMWGCDGRGQDIVAQNLTAAPCYANILLGIDNTDLAPFTDVNMLNPWQEQTLWELNDYGVLADIYRLRHEPMVRQHLEKVRAIKNRIYMLVDLLQDDYRDELMEFHQQQQDVRWHLIRSHACTCLHQALKGRRLLESLLDQYFQTPCECENHDSLQDSISLHSTDIEVINPSFSSSSDRSQIRGNPAHHRLAWHGQAQKNLCKFCQTLGHFSKYCMEPHRYCACIRGGRCLVSPKHTSYAYIDSFMDCLYNRQTNPTLAARGVPAIVTYRPGDAVLQPQPKPGSHTTVVVIDNQVLG